MVAPVAEPVAEPSRIRPASIEREARAILSAGRGTASLLAFARLALGLPQRQPFARALVEAIANADPSGFATAPRPEREPRQ